MRNKIVCWVLVLGLFVSWDASAQNFAKKRVRTDAPAKTQATPSDSIPTPSQETPVKNVQVEIQTNLGVIEAELFAKEVPNTVKNFVDLSKKGFYDGLMFHRVIPDFMIQTGDPTGTGMGGPGYKFADEFSPNLKHDKPGILSMANSGPNTNGSQFFITAVPTPWLDRKHSVFGRVTKGQDVVLAIAGTPRDANDKPLAPVVMQKVTVTES